MKRLVVVGIPAYNEATYITGIVSSVLEYADRVLVMDDGSTDDTFLLALKAGATVISHGANKGYGSAIQTILSRANRYALLDCLVIMDADTQHDPADIPGLVKGIKGGADLVIGSRCGRDIPLFRRVGGWVLSVATRIVSGLPVEDSQSGFRAYSPRALSLLRPRETGMAVGSEVVILAGWLGLKVSEVPISIRYTADSSTHNPVWQGFYTLWRILVIALRGLRR